MSLRLRAASLLVAAVFGATWLAAQDPLRLRVDVALVSLDVFVDDLTGKPITSLTRDDFTALEDGEPREIRNFASAETPYNILLLFDRSSSTSNQWPFLLKAVSRLMEQLPEYDRVALAAFDEKPEMLLDWRNPRTGSRGLTIRTESSGTDVYKALEWAAKEVRDQKGRKGVIVFTDGIDNRLSKDLVSFSAGNPKIIAPAEDNDFQKALRTVMQAGAPFYFVAVNTDLNSGPEILTTAFEVQLRTHARLRMELAADRSNGHIYFPKSLQDVVPIYEQIGKELGTSYSLGFTPGRTAPDGKYHRIEIRTRDKNLKVTQSREGYYSQ